MSILYKKIPEGLCLSGFFAYLAIFLSNSFDQASFIKPLSTKIVMPQHQTEGYRDKHMYPLWLIVKNGFLLRK